LKYLWNGKHKSGSASLDFKASKDMFHFLGVQKHAETKIKLPTSLFHQDHDKSVAEN
jgi:hypothetical protein